jgi:autotransporter translocation and assembly factor TamB
MATPSYVRSGVRIPVELPAQVRWRTLKGKVHRAKGKTLTVSGNGLFMSVPVRIRQNTHISVTLALPVNLTKVPVELRCKARVVRLDPHGQVLGIGAIIDDYQIRPSRRAV